MYVSQKLLFCILVFAAIFSLMATGCLEDGIDQITGENQVIEENVEEAQKMCENILGWICFEMEGCDPSVTSMDCEAALRETIPCDEALSVNSSYYDCQSEIDNYDCNSNHYPDSCMTAINFQNGDDAQPIDSDGDTDDENG